MENEGARKLDNEAEKSNPELDSPEKDKDTIFQDIDEGDTDEDVEADNIKDFESDENSEVTSLVSSDEVQNEYAKDQFILNSRKSLTSFKRKCGCHEQFLSV